MNDKPLELSLAANISLAFEESNLPYKVDIVQWVELSEKFRKIISANYELVQAAYQIPTCGASSH